MILILISNYKIHNDFDFIQVKIVKNHVSFQLYASILHITWVKEKNLHSFILSDMRLDFESIIVSHNYFGY